MAQTDRRTGLVGYSGMKVPVRVASTAALTLSGEQTIDGVACVTDDRVLVKDQASSVDNGIYVVDTGDWNRAADCDGPYDLVQGSLVYVNAGTVGSGFWYCTSADDIDIDTDAITWAKASSVLAAVSAFMQTVLVAATAADARTTLVAAASGANTDITSVKNVGDVTQALTDAATINWDASSGSTATVTLGGNRTVAAPTNLRTGGTYTLFVTQDGTGGRTLTWNAVFKADGGATMPQPAGKASVTTTFTFISPDGTNLQLISKKAQPTRTVLTSGTAATYTTPTGATRINVLCKGGGGNGNSGGAGSANGGGGGGGGGGEGGTAVKLIVGPATSYTYTVGGAGTNSSFGSLTGNFGSGGAAGSTTPRAGIGGSGGSASGGDYNIQGAPGASADNGGGGNNVNIGGLGGNGGGQGGGIGGAAGNNGAAAGQYGAGGGGGGGGDGAAGSAGSGGAGSNGVIVVDEYYD